jgi:hypothetical protein
MTQFAGGSRPFDGAQSRQAAAYCVLIGALVLLSACGSTRKLPEPQADRGQILVNLLGKPKEGVGGPKTEEERSEYSMSRTSNERGRAFERVDYNNIADVVVIVRRNGVEPSGPFTLNGETKLPELTVTEEGFDHQQLLAVLRTTGGKTAAKIKINNESGQKINAFGFNEKDGFDVEIAAGGSAEASVSMAGVYEIYTEQHEFAVCVLHVTGSDEAWFGATEEAAFFDNLTPGEYSITVYPPRLPEWTHTLTVKPAKRETIDAELTVNVLHKCGH